MSGRTYPELGKANIIRCLRSNGIEPDLVDLDSEYDDTLWPSENIAIVCGSRGVRTVRQERAMLQYWRHCTSVDS